jgi:hypothetical protein
MPSTASRNEPVRPAGGVGEVCIMVRTRRRRSENGPYTLRKARGLTQRIRAAPSLADDEQVMELPEEDRRSVIRLVNSLVTAKAGTKEARGRRAVG